MGIGQWLVVAGRFDINYAISSLSRYTATPRERHLARAKDVLGYPSKGYVINPNPPNIDAKYENVELKKDFGRQYSYFNEDLDPRFPPPLVHELDINVFVDTNHAHDKVTRRSITGLIRFVGSTPIIWSSK